jgi:glycine cleavage system H protein
MSQNPDRRPVDSEAVCAIGPDLWVRAEPGGTYRVGLTDAAQRRSGPVAHYRGPTVGKFYRAGEPAVSLESGKWVGHLSLPVDSTVVATNPLVEADPSVINRDPVGAGWLYRVRPREAGALEARGRPPR